MNESEAAATPLYYKDCYLTESTGYITDSGYDEKGRPFVTVSPTIFHPHGGGQKGDRGSISFVEEGDKSRFGDGKIEVVDTRKGVLGSNLILTRELVIPASRPILDGVEVHLFLDWGFRYMQMRLHSTAHLLHCFVEDVIGKQVEFPRTSDLQETFGLNRYEIPGLINESQLAEVIRRLNNFIQEGHEVCIGYDDTPGAPPEARVWRCGKWTIPCGGTHIKSVKEIGVVTAKLSTKRGKTSMTFSVTN